MIIISIRFFWDNFRFSCNCKITYKEPSFALHLLSPSSGKILYNYSSGLQPGNWCCHHPLILLGFHQFIMCSVESVCTCVCVQVLMSVFSSMYCHHMHRLVWPPPESSHRTVPLSGSLVLPFHSHSPLPPLPSGNHWSLCSPALRFCGFKNVV